MNPEAPSAKRLKEFFLAMTRTSFGQLGMADQQVVEYVASVLTDFSAAGNWLALRDAEGRRLTSVVEMLAAQTGAPQTRGRVLGERELRKYVGDYTLFWTGVYPEALGQLRRTCSPDALINYQEQGKRSYYVASRLSSGSFMSSVFRRLSDQFELCAFGLSCVRREWEKIEAEGPRTGRPPRPVL